MTKQIFDSLMNHKPSARTPLLFIGHGNPMNAILDNQFSSTWGRVGKEIEMPKAIIVMSAHWTTRGSYITAMPKPKMIYDFYGFPQEMYKLDYPAAGDPKLAKDVSKLIDGMQLDHEWGLDHGAWSVLMRLFPLAQIPILQLSIDYNQSPQEQYEMMSQIRILREKGVLFLGSGNIVHNLREVRMDNKPYDWSIDFDQISKELIEKGDYQKLIHYEKLGKTAAMAIPTDDHYRPMLLTLGLTQPGERPTFFNEEIDAGSISMRSFLMS